MKRIAFVLAFIAALFAPSAVHAGDLFEYLRSHGSFVGGVAVVDDQKEKIVELRLVEDFPLGKTFRGAARVSLFSIQRAGEQTPTPRIPTSIEEVKAYSDGEVWLSVYRPFNENVAIECLGGITFKMISITGQIGDPLDGTKFAGACGPRLSKNGYRVSVLAGHFGPVTEAKKLAGFVPAVLVHGYIPLAFLGDSTAFVPDLAFGRLADHTLSRTIRLAIATRF